MNISIAGNTGFVGTYLLEHFKSTSFAVKNISREVLLNNNTDLQEIIDWSDVIINLTGAPIIKKWTLAYKKQMNESRIITTRNIVSCINNSKHSHKLLINASAIGIYASNIENDEYNFKYANDFLSELCQQWENEVEKAQNHSKVLILRFGIVLGKGGGALKSMLTPFKYGFGGILGSGNQYFPWIHIHDVCRIIDFAIRNHNLFDKINVVAPEIITNKKFSKELSKALKRPCLLMVPKFILRMIYGKASDVLLESKIVYSKKLKEVGFVFQYPTINEAFKEIFKKN